MARVSDKIRNRCAIYRLSQSLETALHLINPWGPESQIDVLGGWGLHVRDVPCLRLRLECICHRTPSFAAGISLLHECEGSATEINNRRPLAAAIKHSGEQSDGVSLVNVQKELTKGRTG